MTPRPEFKYHNIYLGKGQYTIPGKTILEYDDRVKKIIRYLERTYPNRDSRRNIRVADLGPLEGGHSVILSAMGFDVVMIEGRQSNVDKILWLRDKLELPRSSFQVFKGDVKHLAEYGRFDVILCLGLLYHLDEPASFIRLMALKTDRMIISTHFSVYPDNQYDIFPALNKIKRAIHKRIPIFPKHHYGLSDMTYHDGVPGRWLTEYNKRHDIEKLPASAVSNSKSFWIEKKSLVCEIESYGFSCNEMHTNPGYDSSLFICEKLWL